MNTPQLQTCVYTNLKCHTFSECLVVVVQYFSRVRLCDPMDCSTSDFPVLHHLPEFAQTPVNWVDDAIQPSHPLSSPSPPAPIFPSIRVFSNVLVLHIRWPKYWSFSFSISPSNGYSGLISFRMDWFHLLAVQATLKESSPAPQLESINSLALSLLYGPTHTSIHDYWKNHNFHSVVLCQQMMCLLFRCCLGLSQLFFQGARIF